MGRLAGSKARSLCRTPQSAKAYMALLFDSFFFVPAHAKKKRMKAFSSGRRCQPQADGGGGIFKIKKLFLLALLSDQKRGKSHQRELSPLSRRRQPTHCVHWSIPLSLKSLPCRLAATGANKVPRPSRYSLTMVTGSKRSSADSDLLLCHVRLRRTSRLSFWQKFGCEHSEIGFVSAIHI